MKSKAVCFSPSYFREILRQLASHRFAQNRIKTETVQFLSTSADSCLRMPNGVFAFTNFIQTADRPAFIADFLFAVATRSP